MSPERPPSAPRRIPQWAWELMRWHDQGKVGPRPSTAPRRVPAWYWLWRAWRLALRRPPRDPQAQPERSIFAQRGVLVQQIDVDPHWLGATMRAHGYQWAAVLVFGDPHIRHNALPGFIATLRAHVTVGGYGVQHNEPWPEDHALYADTAIRAHNLSFYIANAEKLYEAMPELSGRFLTKFRALRPAIPLALTTEPQLALDHKAWRDAGADILPQTYTTENQTSPLYGLRSNVNFGWPPHRVHCGISVGYGAYNVASWQYRDMILEARREGMTGGWLYPAELMRGRDAYWDVFA